MEENNQTQEQNPANTGGENKPEEIDNSKICAILSYFFIGIIWYLVDEDMKKSEFAKFHVKQALVLLIASVVLHVAGIAIPFIGWFIILPLSGIITLILAILGVINAATGKKQKLPIIGKYENVFKF